MRHRGKRAGTPGFSIASLQKLLPKVSLNILNGMLSEAGTRNFFLDLVNDEVFKMFCLLIVTSYAIDKNLENKLEINSYFKLEFFVNGR